MPNQMIQNQVQPSTRSMKAILRWVTQMVSVDSFIQAMVNQDYSQVTSRLTIDIIPFTQKRSIRVMGSYSRTNSQCGPVTTSEERAIWTSQLRSSNSNTSTRKTSLEKELSLNQNQHQNHDQI